MPAGALRLVVLCLLASAALAPLTALRAQEGPAPAPQDEPRPEPQDGGEEAIAPDEGADDAVIDEDAEAIEEEESGEWPVPAGIHLSTYASRLCARVDSHGALDSGAAVLQLVDADSGQPLVIHDLGFGRGPTLWAEGELEVPGVEANLRLLATPAESHGDHRVRAIVHVELINHGQDLVMVKLGARLWPGGGDPLKRPADALDFAPGVVFAHEDGVITRDGNAILAWEGPDPQIEVLPPPKTFDAPACTLVWELPVQPNTARYLDVSLAGAGHQPMMDEAGWRETLARFSYTDIEEQLSWQTDFRGEYTLFSSAMPQFNRALYAGVHFLRTLGEANREVQWLTDRPYGFPPTDAAAPAEITGVFFEWGLGTFADVYLHDLVASATASGQQLSPDRRVALVAGLVSAVRLTHDEQLVQDTANVIRSLVVEGGAVEPWLDPAVVRADMAALLVRADPVGGPAAAERLPALHWAADDEGPVAGQMLAARKALSAGDREGFWSHFNQVLGGTSRNGLGSMAPGGDLDGRFAIGLMCLARTLLIDDHGRDLRLLPGVHIELVPERTGSLNMPFMPTIFGRVGLETFHVPGHRLAGQVRLRQEVEPNLIYVYIPAPIHALKVFDNIGGLARLMPDGSVAAAIDPYLAAGLNFTVTFREEPAAR